ncbi:peroxiredoxin-like family protein [Aquibium sp. ELW1220]|uniref:peroxiredoxin-like family protein n=1 Tax=Aquibium sp. ELW1220 TaxID=2976766 RepID=UPI0025B1A954|nr:peroxiredoxin-like family protein [Aquibium sp. ELW1220]MDN2584131.1 AhpC/TSA family protein [Aquibium sp. ELW1220]
MTLQSELDVFRAGWESRVGETIARQIAGDIEDLRATGILDRTARAGDILPAATNLVDQHRAAFDLAALVAGKPVIITFYRGGWCPYCNLELRAYQAVLADIHAAGAELVAVTPELPDHALTTAEKNDLSFAVLSDVGGEFSAALGIRFSLSDAVRPFYEKAGHALPRRNGDGTWALPMPATFVVARGGAVAAAFVEPDYRRRLDPQQALDELKAIRATAAA